MVYEVNRFTIDASRTAAFVAAFAQAAPILRQVPGCLSVALLGDHEVPGLYQVQVEWRRLEDHVEIYPASPQATQVRALIAPFLTSAERRHFFPVALDG